MKRILIADDRVVGLSLKNAFLGDLEDVVCDGVSSISAMQGLEDTYDLAIVEPMHFADIKTHIVPINFVGELDRLAGSGHVCIVSTQSFENVERMFDKRDISNFSYAWKPVDTIDLSIFVGKYLDVPIKLPEDIIDDSRAQIDSRGPMF